LVSGFGGKENNKKGQILPWGRIKSSFVDAFHPVAL
jgi:hypothetical protein